MGHQTHITHLRPTASSDDLVMKHCRGSFFAASRPPVAAQASLSGPLCPMIIHSVTTLQIFDLFHSEFTLQRPSAARTARVLVSRYLRPYCQLNRGKKWPHWTLEATSSSLLFQPQNVGRCRMGPAWTWATASSTTWNAWHGSDAGHASLTGGSNDEDG